MANRAKVKGTAAESAALAALAKWFPKAHRLALNGSQDHGDIGGLPAMTVQVKACHKMELAVWMDQAKAQASQAGEPNYVVIHKRWRKGNAGEWYATMTVEQFAFLYALAIQS